MNQSLTAEHHFEEETIDLREYWSVIRRHIWGILGLSFILSVLAFVIVFSLTPVYQASTTILLESQEANVVSIEEVYGINSKNMDYFYSQIEIMKSRSIAEAVTKKLNLVKHPEFDPEQKEKPFISFSFISFFQGLLPESIKQAEKKLTEEEKQELIFDSVVAQIMDQLSISEHKKSLVVTISFNANSPKLAAQIATEVAKAYIDNGFESNLQMTQQAVSWLTERLTGLKNKLLYSEKKLNAYRSRENLLDVKGIETVTANELEYISQSLSDARRERTKLQSIYYQIQQAKKLGGIAQYEAIPGILSSPAVQHSKDNQHDAQNTVAELSKRYGKKHPNMQAAVANYEKSSKDYLRLLMSVSKGIEGQYRAAKANETALQKDIAQSKSEIRNINTKSFKLKELEREVNTNRQLYDTFFTRFKETSETSGMQTANARIIDEAITPKNPIKPRKSLIVIITLILALGLGCVLAFVKESLNNTIQTVADIDKKLQIPFLGVIPQQKLKKSDVDLPLLAFYHDNKSNFSESIRTIRSGLVMSGLDDDKKITVITSSVPNEGKTTVSINLAMALAQTEKVLLIDADMRRPSIANACAFKSKNGLSTLVAGTSSIQDCIHPFEQWKLDILPSGVVPPNPQELLTSKRFARLLEVLSQKYERIIIDSAPTQAVSDAYLISKHATEVVYIVKADSTPYALAKAGLDKLKSNDSHVAGVVLNQLDVVKSGKYYTGDYYNGYYSNYGYAN